MPVSQSLFPLWYGRYGNVLNSKFHVSCWSIAGWQYKAMACNQLLCVDDCFLVGVFFFLSFFSFFLYWTPWKASYSLALLFSYIFNEPILKFRKHLHLNFKTTNEFSFTLDIIRWTSQKERKKAMKMYNDAWSSCVVGIPPPAYPQ